MNPIKMLVVDDHLIVRKGIRAMLADTEINIVAEAGNCDMAVRQSIDNAIDLMLLDIHLPPGDGISVISRARIDKPELPILVFTNYDNPTYTARVVAMGANGFLLKTCPRDLLLDAIRRVAQGESIWTREELRRVTGALATPRATSGDIENPLTVRETDVLKHLAYGLSNKKIAQVLHISYDTVKDHIQRILKKLGVSDRTQAAAWAARRKII